jgi:DNA primase
VSEIISERTIEEVRDRADIYEVVSRSVQLKKAGKNFVGLCPFHREKTPSFSVNRDKGIFKCFGCGKGGDVFSFLMEIEGLSFVEAVRELAERYGVRIEARKVSKEGEDKRERLYSINQKAERFFVENLKGEQGKSAVAYLKGRGITGEIAHLFKIGYARDQWEGLRDHLRREKIPEGLVAESGLLVQGDRGYYDRFRNRIIFPIRDHRERIVGFGGRVIGAGEPKYLNSPETSIYKKSEILYGLDQTREEIRKSGYALVVEGYLDLIALYQNGIQNVVATLGTALTEQHIKRLSRYAREVTLLFDADEAGERAAERTLPLFGVVDVYARAAVLPKGDDPDSLIRREGRDKFLEIVDGAPDIYDFCLERVFARHDLETAKGGTQVIDEAALIIATKKKPNEVDFYVKRVMEKLDVEESSVRERIKNYIASRRAAPKTKPITDEVSTPAEIKNLPKSEELLLKVAVHYSQVLPSIGFTREHLDLFENEVVRDLIGKIIDRTADGGDVSITSILSDEAHRSFRDELLALSYVDEGEIEGEEVARSIAEGCMKSLYSRGQKKKSREITRRLKKATYDDTAKELLKNKINTIKNMKR